MPKAITAAEIAERIKIMIAQKCQDCYYVITMDNVLDDYATHCPICRTPISPVAYAQVAGSVNGFERMVD